MSTIPGNPEVPRRTAVYRLYDAEDVLLYVGITYNLGVRWTQHAAVQPWWDAIACQKVKWYPSRGEAEDAERTAIRTEGPKYNITYGDPEYLYTDAEQLQVEWHKRVAPVMAYPDGSSGSGYPLAGPYLIAPGTYTISLAYDPGDEAGGYIKVTSLEQVEAGDAFAAEYGAQCVRPTGDEGEPLRTRCSCYRHETGSA